jgi:hypothetical protein
LDEPTYSVKIALRRLRRRIKYFDEEIKEVDDNLTRLGADCASHLLSDLGI